MFFLDPILDLLFPPKCPFCGRLLDKGEPLCPACQRELPWLTGAAGETRVELTGGCVSPLRYQGAAREGIRGYKFGGISSRCRPFGLLVAQCVRDRGYEADLVSWPSLSAKRRRKRGYDQAQLLAKEVGKILGLPVVKTLEKAHRPAQSGLDGLEARRVNVLGAYTAVNPENFRGKTILLVDDVLTTGSTLSECAATLRAAGAAAVVCATLARAD